MANPVRGEVALETPEGVTVLRFSTNALCAMEEDLGKSVAEIGAMFEGNQLSLGVARQFMRAAMRDHKPGATLEDAGAVMDAAGISKAVEAAARAFQLAFPQEEAKGGARPRKAAGGTG